MICQKLVGWQWPPPPPGSGIIDNKYPYRYYSRRSIAELEGYCGLGNVAFVLLERQQRFDRLADVM